MIVHMCVYMTCKNECVYRDKRKMRMYMHKYVFCVIVFTYLFFIIR